jgi:hypothetical protein
MVAPVRFIASDLGMTVASALGPTRNHGVILLQFAGSAVDAVDSAHAFREKEEAVSTFLGQLEGARLVHGALVAESSLISEASLLKVHYTGRFVSKRNS